MARSGDNGVEDSLTAEHHVLEPRDCLDIHGAGGIHGRQISGIHHQGLTGVQIVLHDMPVELGEGNPPAGELLHDEALAAEEAGTQLLLEKDGQLERRLAAAAEYCLKNREAVVVVSGGQGPQESITEALAMERYLVEAGIEKESILREEDSASTRENMVNSKRILDEYFGGEAYDTVIITSGYHVYRAQRQAERAGLECRHIHAGLAWYEAPVRYIRECAAVVKEFITQS